MNDPCSAETKRKETPRDTPGMHTRDYKQRGAPDSRVERHNAVCAHNNVLGGGIVAVPATGMDWWWKGLFYGRGRCRRVYNMKSCLHRKCSPFDDDRLVEVCLTTL